MKTTLGSVCYVRAVLHDTGAREAQVWMVCLQTTNWFITIFGPFITKYENPVFGST